MPSRASFFAVLSGGRNRTFACFQRKWDLFERWGEVVWTDGKVLNRSSIPARKWQFTHVFSRHDNVTLTFTLCSLVARLKIVKICLVLLLESRHVRCHRLADQPGVSAWNARRRPSSSYFSLYFSLCCIRSMQEKPTTQRAMISLSRAELNALHVCIHAYAHNFLNLDKVLIYFLPTFLPELFLEATCTTKA